MPFVRNVVAQWQPRNCDPMVDFLDSWAPIIPVWILDNILDQLIFPKLQKEVGRAPAPCFHLCATRHSLFHSTPFSNSLKGEVIFSVPLVNLVPC